MLFNSDDLLVLLFLVGFLHPRNTSSIPQSDDHIVKTVLGGISTAVRYFSVFFSERKGHYKPNRYIFWMMFLNTKQAVIFMF